MWALIYLLIGFIISGINNHLYAKLETPEGKFSENPIMIIALVGWIIFWPISLIGTVAMFREYYKHKNNE